MAYKETRNSAALALISMTLASCAPGQKPDDRICATPAVTVGIGDMNSCVHKWAYRLAVSPDPAEVVAKAATTACNDVANAAADKIHGTPEQRTEAYAGNMAIGESEALFRVVQARAGHCAIP